MLKVLHTLSWECSWDFVDFLIHLWSVLQWKSKKCLFLNVCPIYNTVCMRPYVSHVLCKCPCSAVMSAKKKKQLWYKIKKSFQLWILEFSVSVSYTLDKPAVSLPWKCAYHVQQKGEGQEKYPKVEVEAVGERALMWVHIPPSCEWSPHTLP